MKQCMECRQQFSPTRDWQDFCSTPCRQRFHYKQRKAQAVEEAEDHRRNGNGHANGHGEPRLKIDLAELGLIAKPEPMKRRI